MTSFLGLHFAASRFSSTPKILYQNYSELLLRLAYLKVGIVSFGNGAGFGSIGRYMYIIYVNHENGAKFQRFLTQNGLIQVG